MMPNDSAQNRLMIFFLIIMVCGSFVLRYHNFISYQHRSGNNATIDENVMVDLARQLSRDPFVYNARGFVERYPYPEQLPGYFQAPLFKHPPLVPYLMAALFWIFGFGPFPAIFPSLFFGCLTIPLVYILTFRLAGKGAACLAAILSAVDPAGIICSQKIWFAVPLTFWMSLALTLYIIGMHRHQSRFFLWGGGCLGLAVLTKYPGILVLFAVFFAACIRSKDLLRNRVFLWSLGIPLIMLLPWGLVNLQVYGVEGLSRVAAHHGFRLQSLPRMLALLFLSGSCAMCLWWGLKKKPAPQGALRLNPVRRKQINLFITGLTALLLWPAVMKGLSFSHLPQATWFKEEFLQADGFLFYPRRLVEFSLLNVLGVLGLFLIPDKKSALLDWIRISAVLYLVFYTLYGNYQTRYVLPFVPLLTVLTAVTWIRLFQHIRTLRPPFLKKALSVLWMALPVVSLMKTMLINARLSFPNDMCYF